MFRFFENLIDPYQSYDERRELPDRLIPFYLHLLWPARWVILISMVLGLAIAWIDILIIWYGAELVDLLATANRATLWQDHGDRLIQMIVVTLVLLPLAVIGNAILMHQSFYPSVATLVRWRTHRKLLRQSVGFFADDFAGRLANKQLQLAPALNDSIYLITSALWYALAFVIGASVIMADVDWRLLIPMGIWFAAYLSIAAWFVPRITRAGKNMAEARSVLAGRIVDSYTNIQTVKLFAHAEAEEGYAKAALDDFRAEFERLNRLHTWLEVAMSASATFLIGGLIGYALWLWTQEESR